MAETANNETIQEESLNEEQKGVLSNLKSIIDDALGKVQNKFESPDIHIMSEGDFEWHVANQIDIELRNNELNYFSVHTQVPWLGEQQEKEFQVIDKEVEDKNMRIDIVILDMDVKNFKPLGKEDSQKGRKGLRYTGISFAIELKFIRPDTTVDNSEIDNDFAKRKSLEEKSWLYIVPLIDDFKKGYQRKEKAIKKMYEIAAEGREDIFYMPLITHPSKESKERLKQIENK